MSVPNLQNRKVIMKNKQRNYHPMFNPQHPLGGYNTLQAIVSRAEMIQNGDAKMLWLTQEQKNRYADSYRKV